MIFSVALSWRFKVGPENPFTPMKINLSLLLAAVLLFQFSAPAQVTNVALFKVTVFNQTSGLPPVAPNFPYAYYFGAQLNMYVADYYQLADVMWLEAPPTSPA